MANPRPTTIDEYIRAAPGAGQPHLRALHAILKRAAPHAEETIKGETRSSSNRGSCMRSPRTRRI